jgi:hypothetical protein
VIDKVTHRGYSITPGLADGTADAFGVADLWFLRYMAQARKFVELHPGPRGLWGSRTPHLPLSSGIGARERSGMDRCRVAPVRMPVPVWDPNPRA